MASACGSRATLATKLVPRSSMAEREQTLRLRLSVPQPATMIHHPPMTQHAIPEASERRHGDNAPRPVSTLRDWLDHLAARDRLAVLKSNIGLQFELAAYAKRLDGLRATLFPRPGGHAIPVVSGLVSD